MNTLPTALESHNRILAQQAEIQRLRAELDDAKSDAAESEAARLGAVECANRLRSQGENLTDECDQLRRRLSNCEERLRISRNDVSGLREQLAARRDDLAEALVACCASIRDCADFRIYSNYSWRLMKTLSPSSDDAVGDDIRTAAAAIRAAIAPKPKPPTPQEVAEVWGRERVQCPGGYAAGKCQKHQVPLIHTITEQSYCAVCEAAEVTRLREMVWTCGCGTVNGVNLATCRVCGRKDGEE